MISVNRASIDMHVCALGYFPKQFSTPEGNIPHKHRISVFGGPDQVILTIPNRMTSACIFSHVTYYTDPSPKGEGFTDPQWGTLKVLKDLKDTEEPTPE